VRRTQIPAPAEWRSVSVEGEEVWGDDNGGSEMRWEEMGKKEAGESRIKGEE
jgi:hypothetical protein